MAEPNNLRDELFPDGQPSPEDAIRTLAQFIREQLGMDEDVYDSCHTT